MDRERLNRFITCKVIAAVGLPRFTSLMNFLSSCLQRSPSFDKAHWSYKILIICTTYSKLVLKGIGLIKNNCKSQQPFPTCTPSLVATYLLSHGCCCPATSTFTMTVKFSLRFTICTRIQMLTKPSTFPLSSELPLYP